MRIRMGKGQVLVFDEYIEKRVEALKSELGYYPSLREIGDSCVPPAGWGVVDRSLRRLAAAGRLSKEALRVYNAKNNIKNVTGDTTHEKRKSRNAQK
jgi:hypothetical protein